MLQESVLNQGLNKEKYRLLRSKFVNAETINQANLTQSEAPNFLNVTEFRDSEKALKLPLFL